MAIQQILHLTKPLDSCFQTRFLHRSGLNAYSKKRGEELSVLLRLSPPLCLVFAVRMQFNLASNKRLFPSRRVPTLWKVPTGNYHKVALS